MTIKLVKIEIFFSPVCSHCPGAKKLVAEVASRYGDNVEVEEINTYTPEGIKRGMANGVMSIPTVFVEGKKKFVGFPFKEEDIVASIDEVLGR